MDALQIWNSFSERIATIYLPDRKRPMLPTCLSECLCSLKENQKRFAFTCDFTIQNNEITRIEYSNCLIKVKKNYSYEEDLLKKDDIYINVIEKMRELLKNYRFVAQINDSHDLIHYLMIVMNNYCGKKMVEFNNGIYRSSIFNKQPLLPDNLPNGFVKFIRAWNSLGGQYVLFNNNLSHDLLELEGYIHITSPIRRLPDLLNIIQFQKNMKLLNLSEFSDKFYNNWTNRLEYINTTMRSIRKVQVDCNLLNYVQNNEDVTLKVFKGIVFDMIKRNDGLYQYICYIDEIKLTARITLRESLQNYECIDVKLFIFIEEDTFKKKIRLQKI